MGWWWIGGDGRLRTGERQANGRLNGGGTAGTAGTADGFLTPPVASDLLPSPPVASDRFAEAVGRGDGNCRTASGLEAPLTGDEGRWQGRRTATTGAVRLGRKRPAAPYRTARPAA